MRSLPMPLNLRPIFLLLAWCLFGLEYARKPADKNHPYGHGKIEPLITFIVVGFLVVSAGIIAHESVENIQTPHASPKPWTLIVLTGIIIMERNILPNCDKKKQRNAKFLTQSRRLASQKRCNYLGHGIYWHINFGYFWRRLRNRR